MSNKIGHFEILSELAKSPAGIVYKANDPESGQTIALKSIQLSAFGEHASALEQALVAEAESTKILSNPNITSVYGAGEIEGNFCAAMEYVQGNSIATMLARKEGFSIWDLLDIGRQLSSGLDHAASHKIVHYSLEPSKIMCGWDGTVKILSYGVSCVGKFIHHVEGVSSILHYMSPEQVRGDATDARSNLFSLGAIFYEMVTERKAFDREDVESLRQSILESTPVAPAHVNPKIHPLLSDLIMKALAKDPAERYQTGRELLDDLEKCKESKPLAAKKAEPAKGTTAPGSVKAASQTKFVSASPKAPVTTTVARGSAPASSPSKASTERVVAAQAEDNVAKPAARTVAPKAAAAAAGVGASDASSIGPDEIDLSDQFVAPAPTAKSSRPTATMSAAAAPQPEVETFEPQIEEEPKIAVDPMMAGENSGAGKGTSFSEISELPPLKEVYVAPAPPPAPVAAEAEKPKAPSVTVFEGDAAKPAEEEKPKVQPREVAEKAIKEVKNMPPRLLLYSLVIAGIVILLIGVGVTLYIHSIGSEDDSGAPRKSTPATEQAPAPTRPQAEAVPQQPQEQPAPVATAAPAEPAETSAPDDRPSTTSKARAPKKKTPAAPAVVLGQISVDSTPQGAEVQIDGKGDPSWVTPFVLTNVQPGQHSITISKLGYVTDTRPIEVNPGSHSTAVIHLAQMTATLIVKSDPPGASIFVDGHDVGTKTPAQVSVAKGQHTVLVRLSGYIDETMSTQFALGQTLNFSPTLRALGNVDSIKTVGKMSKFFGGKGDPNQATLSIRTQPKGAQISVNQRMLDKSSPVDVALDPGNYLVDITMTGYAPIHKVINAEKKSKVVIDETLQPQ